MSLIIGEQEGFKPRDIFNDYTLLEPYSNKLFLMRLQDFPYIHLGGEDRKCAKLLSF